jgi:hypothetical protein
LREIHARSKRPSRKKSASAITLDYLGLPLISRPKTRSQASAFCHKRQVATHPQLSATICNYLQLPAYIAAQTAGFWSLYALICTKMLSWSLSLALFIAQFPAFSLPAWGISPAIDRD